MLAAMPREPNVPDAFDVYTMVLLRRPPDAPAMSDEALDELQARHLAYRADLRRRGVLVANGPLGEQTDESMRGLSSGVIHITRTMPGNAPGCPSRRAAAFRYR